MNYGMSPPTPTTIGISHKCPSAAEFLSLIQHNLQFAKDKLQQAANRAKYYADQKRTPRMFNVGEKVFLQVPLTSTSLSTGKCPKLSPQFCGPWSIVQKLSDVAYRLELPLGCRVHLVFHVSKLKRFISKDTNLVDGLVSLQEDASSDHSPDKILDQREKHVFKPTLQECLVSWRVPSQKNSTWESKELVCKIFSKLIIEDDDLRREENVRH